MKNFSSGISLGLGVGVFVVEDVRIKFVCVVLYV
jgi:hypothetical protein